MSLIDSAAAPPLLTRSRALSLSLASSRFHNFHHVFPWDYSTSEFGMQPNMTKMFIDAMAYIGWAYDLKRASAVMIRARALRTGGLGAKHE